MSQKTAIICSALIIAILVLAVGFATINAVTLTINGNASATGNQANFKVALVGTPVTGGEGTTIASIEEGGLIATMSVTGLTTKGDKATATFEIENSSTDLSASLTPTVTQATNVGFFNVSCSDITSPLATGNKTTVTVTVELIKTPVEDVTTGAQNFKIEIAAAPVEV